MTPTLRDVNEARQAFELPYTGYIVIISGTDIELYNVHL